MSSERLAELNDTVTKTWAGIFDQSKFVRTIQEGKVDKKLYALYMFETFHYTYHNARNQALVGVRLPEGYTQYQKFCFEHANEETGHELMALHDVLSALGTKQKPVNLPKPLPATEVLIGYLYWISVQGNPLQRLGYSFWAENSYAYINPLVEKIKTTLALKTSQMTFFIAHSAIDKDHAEEVQRMIVNHCKTDEDWADVTRVAETSLRLTGNMLEDVYWEHQKLIRGEAKGYEFLANVE